MSGILEQLLAAQLKTNELLQAMLDAGQISVSHIETIAAPVVTGQTLPEADNEVKEADGVPSVELDSDGVPWDVRIHSSNKKRYETGKDKGKWMKKRGVDKTEYETITAQLKAGHALAQEQKAAIDAGKTPPPPAPAGKTPPPPAPGKTPPPPAPAKQDDTFTQAVELITNLSAGWVANSGQQIADGVSPEAIQDYYKDQFNVNELGAVPEAHLDQVISDISAWDSELNAVNEKLAQLLDIYSGDTSIIIPHLTECMGYGNAGLIRQHELATVNAKLADLVQQVS